LLTITVGRVTGSVVSTVPKERAGRAPNRSIKPPIVRRGLLAVREPSANPQVREHVRRSRVSRMTEPCPARFRSPTSALVLARQVFGSPLPALPAASCLLPASPYGSRRSVLGAPLPTPRISCSALSPGPWALPYQLTIRLLDQLTFRVSALVSRLSTLPQAFPPRLPSLGSRL
jgi:hypothetical protein